MTVNPCEANCKTITATAIVKSMPPILRFTRSNRLKYGSQTFDKNRPKADWYPPGNQDNNA